MSTLQYLAKQGLLDRKPWYIYSVYIPIFCNCILYLCFAFVSIFIHPVFQFQTKNFKDRNSIKKKNHRNSFLRNFNFSEGRKSLLSLFNKQHQFKTYNQIFSDYVRFRIQWEKKKKKAIVRLDTLLLPFSLNIVFHFRCSRFLHH